MTPRTVTDDLLANNERFARGAAPGRRGSRPTKGVAIVACMDARLDPGRVLGLDDGDAHVIRNAGGAVTDDTIRSLLISQRLLGTSAVMVIHHTDCGMQSFSDEELKDRIEAETGVRPPFALE
ncbi:MAG: carbonic anhydrase, partial [Actinobacteria bacterium]|nr:carbonic anhydrase [Actinomycetota bacterium]